MARLFSYLRPERGRLASAITSSVLNKLFDLLPPLLVGWLIDTVTRAPPAWLVRLTGSNEPFDQVLWIGLLTVVAFGLESFFQWRYQYGFLTLAQDVQHRLRVDAYRHMQAREMEFFEEHRLGKTLAMLGDDVNQLERFLNHGLVDLIHFGVLLLFAGTALFVTSWELALVGLAPVPVILIGTFSFSRKLAPRYVKVRTAVGDLAARLENNIGGILVIKAFTAEEYEAGRVRAASDDYRAANHDAIKLSAVFVPLIRLAVLGGFLAVILLGGKWVLDGTLRTGSLVMFSMLIQRMLWPMTRLGTTFDEYQRARASAARVFSLLDTPSRVRDPEAPIPLERARGAVTFEDVEFRYRRGEPILNALRLDVAAGETVGVAGTTGAGKSTLVKLLLRLYDVTGGRVLLDGHDVRDLAQQDLRRQIALVSQDVYIFHGTVRENIAYGHASQDGGAPTLEQVREAARLAHLDGFVQTLPEGYETIVGERGIQLSGGQRQRLSLARAILKDAPVLVLDEATSSVDTETERAIQENLSELTRGRSALIIAHRLSTLRGADRIVVMEDGAICEEGTHDALVARGGTYADLWNVQSGVVSARD